MATENYLVTVLTVSWTVLAECIILPEGDVMKRFSVKDGGE